MKTGVYNHFDFFFSIHTYKHRKYSFVVSCFGFVDGGFVWVEITIIQEIIPVGAGILCTGTNGSVQFNSILFIQQQQLWFGALYCKVDSTFRVVVMPLFAHNMGDVAIIMVLQGSLCMSHNLFVKTQTCILGQDFKLTSKRNNRNDYSAIVSPALRCMQHSKTTPLSGAYTPLQATAWVAVWLLKHNLISHPPSFTIFLHEQLAKQWKHCKVCGHCVVVIVVK